MLKLMALEESEIFLLIRNQEVILEEQFAIPSCFRKQIIEKL